MSDVFMMADLRHLRKYIYEKFNMKGEKMSFTSPHIAMESQRLQYLLPRPALAKRVLAYYQENKAFLKTFSPARPDAFHTLAEQRRLLKAQQKDGKKGQRFVFWLALKNQPEHLIGFVALNGIVYGSFRSCYMSYSLSARHARQGYMTEAVEQLTTFAFQGLNLHRVEINIVPENSSSLRVAEKAGYIREGLSHAYLAIDGVWKDHIHMVKLNESLPADAF